MATQPELRGEVPEPTRSRNFEHQHKDQPSVETLELSVPLARLESNREVTLRLNTWNSALI